MLSIQQAGVEILGNGARRSIYFLFGQEYGIKRKYLQHLACEYGCTKEVDSLAYLIDMLQRKSLVKKPNCLYVCRYDDEFVKKADSYSKRISSLSVPGCIACVYDDEKQFKKLDKLFPENVVRFDKVSGDKVFKYLQSDFPELDARYLNLVVNHCASDYSRCLIACEQLNSIRSKLHSVNDDNILTTLGLNRTFTEEQMMICVAAKNFSGVVKAIDSCECDLNYLINGMCHVAIELDKAMHNSKADCKFRNYVNRWTCEDIYNFFDNCYTETLRLRSSTGGDVYESLIRLAALLKFKRIPGVKEVEWTW